MTAALTHRQQRIAHAYGHPIVCLICRCSTDLSHIKAGQQSGTSLGKDDLDVWYETTAKGIEIRDQATHPKFRCTRPDAEDSWRYTEPTGLPPTDTLTWSALTRHINALPDILRDNPAHRDAHQPPGFNEPHHVRQSHGPRTNAQWLAYLIWSDYTRADCQRVLDAAFPLALIDEQPADLFELAGITA